MKKSTKKPYTWLIVIGILIALIAIGYTFFKPKNTTPDYIVANVSQGNITQSVLASGKIEAMNSIDVGAQVSGEVTKLYVNVGDDVQEGDLIAQIDQVTQDNNLSNAKASLTQAQSQLDVAHAEHQNRLGDVKSAESALAIRQAELAKSQAQLNRLTPLIAINAISQREYDDAKADFGIAQTNLQNALVALQNAKNATKSSNANITNQQININKAQNDVATATKNLGYTTIKAPISGTVISVTTEQGMTVNAIQSVPTIVTLANLDRIRIRIQISEADVVKVKAGMKVKFNIIGTPNVKFDGVLASISPAPEKSSSSSQAVYYTGYINVDNKDRKLRIGMTTEVNIIIDEVADTLVIPSSALIDKDGQTQVKVMTQDGQTLEKPVKIGLNNRIQAQVLSGLSLGDTIVVSDDIKDNKPPEF